MTDVDVECIAQRACEKYPNEKPQLISDNRPQFIAKGFKERIRIAGMTHFRISPHHPQSNGKIERWHKTLKRDAIRVTPPRRSMRHVVSWGTSSSTITPCGCTASSGTSHRATCWPAVPRRFGPNAIRSSMPRARPVASVAPLQGEPRDRTLPSGARKAGIRPPIARACAAASSSARWAPASTHVGLLAQHPFYVTVTLPPSRSRGTSTSRLPSAMAGGGCLGANVIAPDAARTCGRRQRVRDSEKRQFVLLTMAVYRWLPRRKHRDGARTLPASTQKNGPYM